MSVVPAAGPAPGVTPPPAVPPGVAAPAIARPGGSATQAQQKAWGGSQSATFAVQLVYLAILAGLGVVYFNDRSLINLPDNIGPLSIAVPWFGALGGVLISLVGTTEHRYDWDPTFRFWHWSRPLLGASFGSISVLIFQAGILAVGATPSANLQNVPRNLLYYLIAFVVGYREETFRDLIKRLTDIIFAPGPTGGAMTVSSLSPTSGSASGGTVVTVLGSGLGNTDTVRFGTVPAQFHIDGDGQLTVTSPPGRGGTTVTVSVAAQSATGVAGMFTYTA